MKIEEFTRKFEKLYSNADTSTKQRIKDGVFDGLRTLLYLLVTKNISINKLYEEAIPYVIMAFIVSGFNLPNPILNTIMEKGKGLSEKELEIRYKNIITYWVG